MTTLSNVVGGFFAALECAATHTNRHLRSQANWTWVSLASQLALDQTSSITDFPCLHSRLFVSTASMSIARLKTNGQMCKKSYQSPSNLLQNISGSKLWAAIGPLLSSLPTNNKRGLNKAGSKEEDVEKVLWIWSVVRMMTFTEKSDRKILNKYICP